MKRYRRYSDKQEKKDIYDFFFDRFDKQEYLIECQKKQIALLEKMLSITKPGLGDFYYVHVPQQPGETYEKPCKRTTSCDCGHCGRGPYK